MTTILPEDAVCPACSHEHTVFVLHSTNNLGVDEDAFIHRGYARCPWCGHKDPTEGVIEWLSDDPEERFLQVNPNFEPAPERGRSSPGTTQVTFGKWISPKKRG